MWKCFFNSAVEDCYLFLPSNSCLRNAFCYTIRIGYHNLKSKSKDDKTNVLLSSPYFKFPVDLQIHVMTCKFIVSRCRIGFGPDCNHRRTPL